MFISIQYAKTGVSKSLELRFKLQGPELAIVHRSRDYDMAIQGV